MSIETVALWIGTGAMAAGGVAVVAVLVIGAAILSNRAQRMAVESYGGWKVFLEFRDWYLAKRPTATEQKEPGKPLTRCAAARDGECQHKACPQLRDGEPVKSGRHCPLATEQKEKP